MPGLFDVIKDIEKISGTHSVMQGIEVKDVERIPLKITTLNRMLYGGIPKGRMIEFSGPEHAGKTTTAFFVIAAYQEQDDRPVFYVDAEGSYDARWAAKAGVDNRPGRFIKWTPEHVNAEEMYQMIMNVAATNEVGLIVIDSLPVIQPKQVDEKTLSDYQIGGVSKVLTIFSNKMQKILLSNDTVTVIGINQARDNMDSYGPTVLTPGGRAWKHITSVRLTFKSEFIDANGNYLSQSAENPAGVRIIASLLKNKTAPRDRRIASYNVSFTEGFDPIADLVDTALALKIVKQKGSWFSYSNAETGEVLINVAGKVAFRAAVTPEIEAELRRRVNAED